MSNRRRPKRKIDKRAGAELVLLLSARRDGCICESPVARLQDMSNEFIIGDVIHFDPACPLFAAGPAAPHKLEDIARDLS